MGMAGGTQTKQILKIPPCREVFAGVYVATLEVLLGTALHAITP
jgi:hypothetical protein